MPAKIIRVKIQADRERLREFLYQNHLDLNCGGASRQADGSFLIEAFIREDQLKEISRADLQIEIMEDARAKGKERQKEVGRENRFARNLIPHGVGKKI
jgi:hypothetical protein